MSINAKHLATFILGAAAGVALNKYLQTPEGEKTLNDLKEKAGQLKTEAEDTIDKAPEYFEKLKNEGADMLKEKFPDLEKLFNDLFKQPNPSPDSNTKAIM
ncbi:MAG: YtxH domain-containing protein [Pseudarcicella sp.]|jgi:gas vesicle protein|nr:YtxH domain-containing protein [Pseudarcicella sp.]MBP6411044.1 YtxH domain-containing protein [Pseudarcicella sp.]